MFVAFELLAMELRTFIWVNYCEYLLHLSYNIILFRYEVTMSKFSKLEQINNSLAIPNTKMHVN